MVGRCEHSSAPRYSMAGLGAPLPSPHSPRDDAFWFSRPAQAQEAARSNDARRLGQRGDDPSGPWRRPDAFPIDRLARADTYPSRSPFSRTTGRAPQPGSLRDDPRMPRPSGQRGDDDLRRGPHRLQQQEALRQRLDSRQHRHEMLQQRLGPQPPQGSQDSDRPRPIAQPSLRQQMQV